MLFSKYLENLQKAKSSAEDYRNILIAIMAEETETPPSTEEIQNGATPLINEIVAFLKSPSRNADDILCAAGALQKIGEYKKLQQILLTHLVQLRELLPAFNFSEIDFDQPSKSISVIIKCMRSHALSPGRFAENATGASAASIDAVNTTFIARLETVEKNVADLTRFNNSLLKLKLAREQQKGTAAATSMAQRAAAGAAGAAGGSGGEGATKRAVVSPKDKADASGGAAIEPTVAKHRRKTLSITELASAFANEACKSQTRNNYLQSLTTHRRINEFILLPNAQRVTVVENLFKALNIATSLSKFKPKWTPETLLVLILFSQELYSRHEVLTENEDLLERVASLSILRGHSDERTWEYNIQLLYFLATSKKNAEHIKNSNYFLSPPFGTLPTLLCIIRDNAEKAQMVNIAIKTLYQLSIEDKYFANINSRLIQDTASALQKYLQILPLEDSQIKKIGISILNVLQKVHTINVTAATTTADGAGGGDGKASDLSLKVSALPSTAGIFATPAALTPVDIGIEEGHCIDDIGVVATAAVDGLPHAGMKRKHDE